MKNTTNTIIKEYAIENKYKVLGFNDDECNCDVCGKTELKGTYAIEDLSTGEILRAGSVCGAKMAGWTKKELMKKYKDGEKEKINNAKKEFWESIEYIQYDNAIKFLHKEQDELEHNYNIYRNDELKMQELRNSERTRESRWEYLDPFINEKNKKKQQIIEKYNLPLNSYLG